MEKDKNSFIYTIKTKCFMDFILKFLKSVNGFMFISLFKIYLEIKLPF